ncbi:MAG: hypothetical protein IT374_18045 [Polyangiaceae bacterium]|nr:hypothetical protein [Polyangiaceae bacterium]
MEPYVAGRLAVGAVALACLAHAASVGVKTLRYFRLRSSAEGQLALERYAELGATTAKVGAVALAVALPSSALTADRLAPSLRGAMCGWGVVHADRWGSASMTSTVLAALLGLVVLQLHALDRRTRGLALVRPLASLALLGALVAAVDLALAWRWLAGLDFSVVASCCSSGVDEAGGAARFAEPGPRALVAALALALGGATIALGGLLSRRPSRGLARGAGVLALLALPALLTAIALVVAPHVYEVPHHRCPYCLLRADAWFLGYGLFGAALVGVGSALALGLASLIAPADEPDVVGAFARAGGARTAAALGVALSLGALPVVRYLALSGGASLGP